MPRLMMKILGLGAAATLGLASASALAQQSVNSFSSQPSNAQAHQQMMGGANMGGMMEMMNNAEMRQQMQKMMTSCNQMMQNMAKMDHSTPPRQ